MLQHCPNKQTLCHCDCRPPEGPRCQKFVDPPLEEDGFEPPVPLGSNTSVSAGFVGWRGGRGLLRKAPVLGRDRQFESVFLQRRVVRTMVTAATWSRTAASVSRLSLVSCFQVTSTPWGSDSSATGATPTLPTSASKATAFHVWLRRSVPDAEHLMRCPSRMAENTAMRRFCAQCGTPLPSPCPSCGFENEPSARFCGGCGKPPRGDCRSSPSGRARAPAHR